MLLALFLLVSCGGYPEHPRQHDALHYVWNVTYHATVPSPAVWWTTDCTGPQGQPGVEWAGACKPGIEFQSRDLVELAWLGSFHASAFAHELLHAWQWARGIYDPQHQLPDWITILPEANLILVEVGL